MSLDSVAGRLLLVLGIALLVCGWVASIVCAYVFGANVADGYLILAAVMAPVGLGLLAYLVHLMVQVGYWIAHGVWLP